MGFRSEVAAAVACGTVLVGCAVSDRGTWFTAHTPTLTVSVAAGCIPSNTGYADVVNTVRGPPLVPARPTAGIICRYGPHVGSGLPSSGRLVRSTRLDAGQAQALAAEIRQIDLRKPSGAFGCALDVGTAAVLGFSYRGHPDVGLWYAASGCQTLDNGRIGGSRGANPSFYDGFETVVDRLSPPVPSL